MTDTASADPVLGDPTSDRRTHDEPARTPAIEVEAMSASYHVRLDSDSLLDDVRRLVRRQERDDRIVPALRDIDLVVPTGRVCAVIGRNGAGKSTLMRVIAGILPPDSGRIVVNGRLSLLAPGLGFNPMLTGRANIRLGGLAAGLPPGRLDDLADEIAEFAQLGEYIDFPMRTYSSGMRMRLSVAVAAFLDPEILVIDEALTGGDQAFQAHMADKMAELTGRGRTILLVTHGLSSVRRMATDAVWLHQGRIEAEGDPEDVLGRYMRYCRLEALDMEYE